MLPLCISTLLNIMKKKKIIKNKIQVLSHLSTNITGLELIIQPLGKDFPKFEKNNPDIALVILYVDVDVKVIKVIVVNMII